MRLDVLATEDHFGHHLRPTWDALPEDVRGCWHRVPGAMPRLNDAVLVASYGDHKRARDMGYTRIARAEHGAGQSYAGDPHTARQANYAGGQDAADVGLFLVPGPHPAARWADAYPAAKVVQVGSPRLDRLPAHTGPSGVVALSFHFNAYIGCPEADSAWRWYRSLLPELARQVDLVGHAHPRWAARIRPWFLRAGARWVDTFDEVCRVADVYAVDNSSTLFEFASTGRRVVVLDCPAYRRSVHHGLRYWDAATVGHRATPATVVDVLHDALAATTVPWRPPALDLVYSRPTGGARLAADALTEWLAA